MLDKLVGELSAKGLSPTRKIHPFIPEISSLKSGVFRIPSCRSSYMNEAPSVVDGVISPQ